MNIDRPALLFALLLACAALGWWLKSTDMPAPEVITAAPQRTQADGSVVAERRPQAKPQKLPHKLPRGSTEERRVAVTVQPTRDDCPPVRVDLSLVREGDGRRVVASSPDGQVVSAIDVPIEAAFIPPPPRPWAAGISYDPVNRRSGAWVERDLARLRLGVDVQQGDTGELRFVARAGWRW